MKKRLFLKSALTGMALAVMPMTLSAQEKDTIRVGYMKIPPLAHMIHGIEKGIFDRNGLNIELSVLNGGPELMTALASGSVDVGMTATGIVLIARGKGLKLKAFGTSDLEASNDIRNWIIADENDGIKSLKDLEGKTVGITAKNSPAELTIRDHMMAAGADPNTVKFVALPFPQLGPALEVGNVDAVHVVEPFHTQLMNSDKIKAIELAKGIIALEEGQQIALGGWFAKDDWLADPKNRDIAARYLKSVMESNKELAADRALVDAIFEKDFGMPPPVAKRVPLPLNTQSLVAVPETYSAQLKAFVDTGMLPSAYPIEDVVDPITYE